MLLAWLLSNHSWFSQCKRDLYLPLSYFMTTIQYRNTDRLFLHPHLPPEQKTHCPRYVFLYLGAYLTENTGFIVRGTFWTKQAVSWLRRPLTAKSGVWSRVSPCDICGWQNGIVVGVFFPPVYCDFPLTVSVHPRCTLDFIHRLLLPEGKPREAKKQMLLPKLGSSGQTANFTGLIQKATWWRTFSEGQSAP